MADIADLLTADQRRLATLLCFRSPVFVKVHRDLQAVIDRKDLDREDLAALQQDPEAGPLLKEISQFLRFAYQQALKRSVRRVGQRRRKRRR